MRARTAAVLGRIWNFIAIMVIGVSVGWLAGLSSSPLFSVVMSALLTLIASALAATRMMRGPGADASPAISVRAIAIFAIGLAGGASLGTLARLGDWFAPDPAHVIAGWSRWRTVIPHDDVVRRVFERTLPDPYRVNDPAPPPTATEREVVLDGDATCRVVVAQADGLGLEELKAALRARSVPWAAAIAPIHDAETLRDVAKNLCSWEVSLHR